MAGTENTIFSDAIIKLKHATKSVADASDKVLEKDEVLLVSPNSGSGTGAYEMRVGDGSTPVKNLPVAINGMKADNINVEEIETIEEENPTLEGGNAIKNLFGRISKKFSWIETMLGKKVNTADIYDGLDSSNAGKVASANAVRQINEKTDKNTTDISTLTSNLKTPVIGNPTFDSSYFTNKGTQIKKIGTTVTVKIVGTIKFDAMTSFATNKIMDIPEGFRPIWSIGEYHILGKNVTDLIMIESTSIGINKQFSSGNQNVEFSIIYLTSE